MKQARKTASALLLSTAAVISTPSTGKAEEINELMQLSLDELMQMEVTPQQLDIML